MTFFIKKTYCTIIFAINNNISAKCDKFTKTKIAKIVLLEQKIM